MNRQAGPDGETALDHPRRRAIVAAVRAQPGMNWSQLQRRTGLSVGALMFHLERLEAAEAVLRRDSTSDNEVLFFTPDTVDLWRDPRTRLLFGNESTRRIAEIVAERPGCEAKEIAQEVGLTPAAVRYHLNKLEEQELLESERRGRSKHFSPSDPLSDWVERLE